MQYDGALRRLPDSSGFAGWLGYLGASCDAQRIRNTTAAFYWSGEHRAAFPVPDSVTASNRVRSIYRGMLGREPDSPGLVAWSSYFWSGGPASEREAPWDILVGQFANSSEFSSRIFNGAVGEQALCP